MILPKVEEEESLEKEFKWVVEGLLLPLVCLVGVLGNIDISLWIKRTRKWKIKTQLLKHISFLAIIFGIRFTFMPYLETSWQQRHFSPNFFKDQLKSNRHVWRVSWERAVEYCRKEPRISVEGRCRKNIWKTFAHTTIDWNFLFSFSFFLHSTTF